MNRNTAFSAALLLGVLTGLPALAQEAPRPRPPAIVVAAKGLPNLTQFPRISLVLPNETVPLELNIATQNEEGRFAGEAVRPGAPPGIILGLIEPTETGGFMVEFTVEPKGGPQRLFQGSIFVAEAVGGTPRKMNLSGIYSQVTGDTPTDGPFPFSGTATAAQAARDPAALRAAARAAAAEKAAIEAGKIPAPALAPAGNPLLRSRFRLRGLVQSPEPAAPAKAAPLQAAPLLADRLRVVEGVSVVPKNVMEALERRNNLKIFASLVKIAGLEDSYRKVKMTVFAPEDAAFNKLPFGVLDSLRKNPENAKKYIGYCTSYRHKYLTKGPAGAEALPPTEVDVNTGRLGVSRSNGRLWIMGNDSRRSPVLEENIDAGLGALYVTGVVLIQKSVRFD